MPIYLKYGSIKGEVTEPAHRGWIEPDSVQWGTVRKIGPSTERERPTQDIHEIVVTKKNDSTSARLFQESFGGQAVVAVIEFVRDGHVYLRVVMSGALISSYNISGSGNDPRESLTLNFTGFKSQFTPGTPAETDDWVKDLTSGSASP